MVSGVVVNSVRDTLTIASQILESAKEEVIWLVPLSIHSLSRRYGFIENADAFIQRGGVIRGVINVVPTNIPEVLTSLDSGADVRHSDEVKEIFMFVGDRQYSVSAINIGVGEYTLETPVVAFWSESPTYAEYLRASFETAWSQAIPAQERIQELLKQG